MKQPYLTIFFPYLNDWGTVGSMILLSASAAKKLKKSFEILVIDDGSNKMSRDALDVIKSQVPNLRVIHHKENTGYGGALRSGFKNAHGKLIFYTDGDAQYDVRELSKLFLAYEPGAGLVNGFKEARHDPWYRTVLGGIYHHTVKMMFGLKIRDTDCDFRLIEKRVFNKVKLFESSGTICVELVKKISHFGYKIKEVPVSHYDRPSGFSQFFNLSRLYRTGIGIIKLWWKLIIKQKYFA